MTTPHESTAVRRITKPPAFVSPVEVLFPIDGHDVLVRPVDVDQIAQLMSECGGLFDAVTQLSEPARARLASGDPSLDDVAQLLGLLQVHAGLPARLVDIAVRQPDWSRTLLPDRFAYVFAMVVQVNADFFSQARGVFGAAAALLRQAKPLESTGPASSTA